MIRKIALALGLILAAPSAIAAPIGIEGFDPLITPGFNPQPETPPEFDFITSQVVNPIDVVAQVSGIDPQPFLLSLSVSEGVLVPPEPILPDSNMFAVLLRTGGEELTLAFTLFVRNGSPMWSVASSRVSGDPFLNLGFLIENTGGGSPDAVGVRMQVFRDGSPLGLSAVPVPASALLLLAGIAALGFVRRRS